MLTLPLNRGLQVGLIKWTERPSTWIERPTCSTYRDHLAQSTTMDFMHPYQDVGETGGRPTNFSFKPTQPSIAI